MFDFSFTLFDAAVLTVCLSVAWFCIAYLGEQHPRT